MTLPIEQEFSSRGVVRGGLLLLRPTDALKMVRRAHESGLRILGVDGFQLTDTSTQPLMQNSVDLSRVESLDSAAVRAEELLTNQSSAGLFFEIILEPPS